MCHNARDGFTLIELSIVLVIIGLIAGGILTGQDLIKAASLRAQIAQIEKYNTAVRAFQNKYGGLPGDLALGLASNFGFVTSGCNGGAGARDGNGIIEGFAGGYTANNDQFLGETGLFWEDLSIAGLVDGTFPSGGGAARNCTPDATPITLSPGAYYVGNFIPVAKIGNGNFVYVYTASGGTQASYTANSDNWYGVSQVTGTGGGNGWSMTSGSNIPVISAYNIDKKMDDGLPVTGNIVAYYSNLNGLYPTPNAAVSNSTTCFDTGTYRYSIGVNSGSGANCALSFRFQ